MLELFEAGGFSMFGVVGFGLAALVASALFARRPRLDKLGFIAGMALATGFMSLAGTAMDFAKVLGVAVEAGASGKLPPA